MKGTVKPDGIYIINNGVGVVELRYSNMTVYNPGTNLGVAASWNWFIKNVPQTRLICNDDIIFFDNSIEKIIGNCKEAAMYCPNNMLANSFSCFVLTDSLLERVGLFDETISPNYAYFEDNDYYRRMQLLGLDIKVIEDCFVGHEHSSTLKRYTAIEKSRHDEKFRQARYKYKMKWGGEPGKEVFKTPYGR